MNSHEKTQAVRAMSRLLADFKEGHSLEPTEAPVDSVIAAASRGGQATGFALSQLDDYLHRGSHPLVKDMSLYVYSIWVYRVELSHQKAREDARDESNTPHVDIPFHPSYRASKNWKQRIAVEPRVPKVSGFQFVAGHSNAETHYLMKSLLLELPDEDEEVYTKELRYLQAYKALCSPPPGEQWPAQRKDASNPGPFQRGWSQFIESQTKIAQSARGKCLRRDLHAWSVPSLWTTREVEEELVSMRDAREWAPDLRDSYDKQLWSQHQAGSPFHDELLSVAEYIALETVKTSAHFDGLADARSKKPKRQLDEDVKVVEKPVFEEHGSCDGHDHGIGQVEGAEERAKQGLATLGANARLAHRFDPATSQKILAFDTAERTQAFVKDLKQTPLMASGELPHTNSASCSAERRKKFREELLGPLDALGALSGDALAEVLECQRKRFATGGKRDDDAPVGDGDDAPAAPHDAPTDCPADVPAAVFVPSDEFKRPSDYVKHLARRFESGKVDTATGKLEPRPLKRDQALFVARFASACNDVWDDEQSIIDGSLVRKKRRSFQFLLMGQSGSGKTAIVQEIVLPAMDNLFPVEPGGRPSSLIVCAKWSQAENISTPEHKAVSCHKAGLIRVQSYKNRDMLAGDKSRALKRTWEPLRCLVLEEVSMISPYLYNMLAYRSFLGRANQWEVSEQDYDQLKGAFGRMPIVIHLGDFLQLKSTGSNVSLIADFNEL